MVMREPRIRLTPEMLNALTRADQGEPVSGEAIPRKLRGVLMAHGLIMPVDGSRSGLFRTTAKGRKERFAAAAAMPAIAAQTD